MGGIKETYQISLNGDHMAFVQSTKDKYEIADESKVIRIVMDYLMTNPEAHDAVFKEVRCLRCE